MKKKSLHFHVVLFAIIRIIFNVVYRMIYPFLTVFSRGLGVDIATVSRALANRSLIGALGPFLAAVADHKGRKFGMLLGMVLLTLGLSIIVVWPTYPAFLILLIFTTLGKYIFDPSMQAYIGDRVPYQRRGRTLAITEVGWSLSFIIGIPVVSFMIDRWGWQSPYLGFVFFCLIGGGLLRFYLPDDTPDTIDKPKIWRNLRNVVCFPAALAGLAVGLTASSANEVINLVFGVWMEDSFAFNVIALGGTAAIIGFAELGGEVFVGVFVDRLGKVNAIRLGLFLNCLAAVALPILGNSTLGALLGLFLFYLTFEFTLVSIIPLMTEIMPDSRATLMAFNVTALSLGRALGALIVTPLYRWGIVACAGGAVLFNFLGIVALKWMEKNVK